MRRGVSTPLPRVSTPEGCVHASPPVVSVPSKTARRDQYVTRDRGQRTPMRRGVSTPLPRVSTPEGCVHASPPEGCVHASPPAPRGEDRGVDALASKQRADLTGDGAGVGLLDDALLVVGAEASAGGASEDLGVGGGHGSPGGEPCAALRAPLPGNRAGAVRIDHRESPCALHTKLGERNCLSHVGTQGCVHASTHEGVCPRVYACWLRSFISGGPRPQQVERCRPTPTQPPGGGRPAAPISGLRTSWTFVAGAVGLGHAQ